MPIQHMSIHSFEDPFQFVVNLFELIEKLPVRRVEKDLQKGEQMCVGCRLVGQKNVTYDQVYIRTYRRQNGSKTSHARQRYFRESHFKVHRFDLARMATAACFSDAHGGQSCEL